MFPGDPPIAELLAELAVLPAVLTAAVFLGAHAARERLSKSGWIAKELRQALAITCALFCIPIVVAAVVVGLRHTGEWVPLRDALRAERQRLAALAPESGVFEGAEFERLRDELLDRRVELVTSSNASPIRLRMMSPYPPYVGLDFGKGGTAMFNPTTMFCIYTD